MCLLCARGEAEGQCSRWDTICSGSRSTLAALLLDEEYQRFSSALSNHIISIAVGERCA